MNISSLSNSKLPVVRQTTMSECGLACLAMIAGYHGKDIDLYTIRSRFATSLRGMNFVDLRNVADKLGFASRGVRVDLQSLHKLQKPCILHWKNMHFVVLKKVHRKYIIIHDPSSGVVKVPMKEVEESFQGYAMELSSTVEFEKGKERDKPSMFLLFKGMVDVKQGLVYIFLISLALELFVNLLPLYTQWVIDDVVTTADYDLLTILFIGYIFVILFQAAIGVLRSWVMLRFGIIINANIQTRVFTHLLKLPCSFFEQRYIGDVVSRYHSLNAVQGALTTSFVSSVLDGIMCIFVGTIIFIYSKMLASIALGFVVLYGIIRWLRYLPFKTAVREQLVARALLDSHFLETIRGVRGIKLFNKQGVRRDQWYRNLYDTYNKDVDIAILNLKYGQIGAIISGFERGLVIYLGAQLVIEGSMTVGFLLAFLAYKDQFVGRMNGLIEKAVALGMVQLEVERLWDIMGTAPEEEPQLPYIGENDITPNIELKDVSFRYSDYEPYIINSFNQRILAGEHVVIVGPSGSGKSTIAKLISGVQQPGEGEILIGGVPLTNLGSEARKLISCVMQDDELYSGTLLENISFFDSEPDMDRIEECTKLAEMHQEIIAMKMGYNSIIGDMGSALSGGQKQRILLARAMYAQPKILVLDESTSALDVELEKRINENIKRLDITRITIAHRPQTIAAADRKIEISAN
ncbi:peptidase domain-containing ABC transporter [Agarivorans sp. Alg241-V36]|uniref:peptidase domain-containing ABC transporter n=1 Tax=Agarivorans sp. Alg241-V36 TaxID=2305992 RepID=UPI0013D867CF|nr:peptidase domain-containing ABC transporter [Agarivorans sp. Alg241-V36]